jgi:hypothetical protein
MKGIDVTPQSAARFHQALEDISNISRLALGSESGPDWECPECGNVFSQVDGTRICTRHERHYCPLPEHIRLLRNRRDIAEKPLP